MPRRLLFLLLFTLTAFSFFGPALPACAQTTSNSGTNFWIGYTGHIDGTQSQMSLYLTSNVNTTATVSIPLLGTTSTYTITANSVTIAPIPSTAYVGSSEITENKGIQVVAEQPIVVYAHIYAQNRSGATLVLPANTLGREYYAATYLPDASNQYAEFMVVATEDNTQVEITPKAMTRSGRPANVPFPVTLNKGQVYQVQSAYDLTGSKVVSVNNTGASCKKIAVFSGNSFVGIGCTGSRDNLYQQLYPLSTWGKNFITAPFKTRQGGDVFRVLAASDNTTVTVNGSNKTLNAGSYWEFNSSSPNSITADKPVTLAQYARTQNCDNITGDPDMIIINPIEQTLEDITLYSSPYYRITGHYINVVMKTADAPGFRLDGAPVSFSAVIANPAYSYAQVTVAAGNHRLTAAAGFNAVAYGFGNVESYGYSAGANVRSLEQYITADQSTFCGPGTVNFLSNLTYTPTSLKWYFPDNTTSSQPNPTKTFTNPGKYKVALVTTKPNAIDCDSKDSTTLEVVINPQVTAELGADRTLCSGEKITLGPTAQAGVTYSWTPATGLSAVNAANPVFTLTNPTAAPITRKYYLAAQDAATGCSARDSVTLTVLPALDRAAGPDVTLCSKTAGLIGLPGQAGYTYQWSPATGLSDATAAQPTIQLTNPTNPALVRSYIRTATFNGCTVSDTVQVTVHALPLVTAGPKGEAELKICGIFGDVENRGVLLGGMNHSNVTYSWSPAAYLTNAAVANPQFLFAQANGGSGLNLTDQPMSFTYHLTATDQLTGCVVRDSVRITVVPVIRASAGPDQVLCTGQSVRLGTPARPGQTFFWSPATGLSSQTEAQPTLTLTNNTQAPVIHTFLMTVSEGDLCPRTDTVTVTVSPRPGGSITGSASVCPHVQQVAYRIADPQDHTYEWGVRGGTLASQAGSSITVNWGRANPQALVYAVPTNRYGCVGDTIKFPVRINVLLIPEMPQGPAELCRKDKNNVTYQVGVTNGSVYTWNISGGQVVSGQGTHQVQVSWDESGRGKLWIHESSITATDKCFGTSDTLFFRLIPNTTFADISAVGTQADNENNMLVHYSILTRDQYPAGKTFALQRRLPTDAAWQTIAAVPLAGSEYLDAGLATGQQQYEYRLTGTNTCDSVLASAAHASILLSGAAREASGNLQLQWNTYNAWAPEPVRYEVWRKLDEETDFSLQQSLDATTGPVVLTLPVAGFVQCYRIRAVAGSKESWSNSICLEAENALFIPNIITPNNDGKNDRFEIRNLSFYPGTQLQVFNRWGQQVYSSADYRGDWQAPALSQGTYYYQLSTRIRPKVYKGWVEVVK